MIEGAQDPHNAAMLMHLDKELMEFLLDLFVHPEVISRAMKVLDVKEENINRLHEEAARLNIDANLVADEIKRLFANVTNDNSVFNKEEDKEDDSSN